MPELLGALVQLDVPARMDNRPIDAEAVREYLADRKGGRQPRVGDIAALTARYFALKVGELRGSSRRRPVVAARDVAMYLARSLTGMSLQQIGTYFGGRDHTTVIHACRKTETLVESDAATAQAIEQLRQKLQGE